MTLRLPRSPLFVILLVAVATCPFLPGLGGGFIFDDTPNIVTNNALHLSQLNLEGVLYATYSFQPGHGSRSLSMLSFALDYWRGDGLDPRVFKTTNLLIHALTTFALVLMVRRLLSMAHWPARRAAIGASVLALAWAIHPLQVSSVLYVVQRMQTLGTLFLVLGLWAYLGMRRAQMEGARSRLYGVLTVLFWVLGFAAKEDAILLPLYTLMLELTVLRFRAERPGVAWVLRKGYSWLTVAGAAVYLLVVVPHFWSWSAYPGRDFSSWERLLSQGRALVMYLGQIVWPLPSRLPFYYDDFVVSRSLWNPISTFPALLLLAGLLAWAWYWRVRRSLFALGVLLFFAGHFMTSNVIGLELAFEHRNHFPLIGILLAVGDLGVATWQRWHLPRWIGITVLGLMLTGMGVATFERARDWGDPLRFSTALVTYSPHSERAWLQLAGVYASRAASRADSPDLTRAIEISQKGVGFTGSLPLLSNIVINKTIKGDVTQKDWDQYLQRLRQVPMSVQNRNTVWALLSNFERGVPLDKEGVRQAIEIVSMRWDAFGSYENLRFGAFIYNETRQPSKALAFLRQAVELAEPGDPDIAQMLAGLKTVGREDWARELEQLRTASQRK